MGLLEPSFFWWWVFLQHLRAKPADATKRGNLAIFSRTREQGASKIKPWKTLGGSARGAESPRSQTAYGVILIYTAV